MAILTRQVPAVEGKTKVYGRNVFVSVLRLIVIAMSGLMLPAFLSHRLPPASYGAWILVLQVSGYVGYLEFGVTTAISKYVAEHTAARDVEACNRHASAGVAITCTIGILGILVSLGLAALVPLLFHDMQPALLKDVAMGVLLVGTSLAILLAAAAFSGIFMGLQRFTVPMVVTTANKIFYVLVILIAVKEHATLTQMGFAVAVVNIVTAVAVVLAWAFLAPEVKIKRHLITRPTVNKMLGYCATLGIWTSGMLLISGLDTTIVGHFSFSETAFYAVAATPSVFLTLVLQAVLEPLMPAVSAASVDRTPEEMGSLVHKASRYSFLLSQLSGLPFLIFAYGILRIWVGPTYAAHGFQLLRILVAANMLRNVFGPYATMVIATGLQRYATLSGVSEAIINLAFSILLGKYYGAIGVAYGTLIGAFVGVMVHLFVSLRKTNGTFAITPGRLLRSGFLRPGTATIPTLFVLPILWHPFSAREEIFLLLGWALSSLLIGWSVGLQQPERSRILQVLGRRWQPA